MLATTAKRLPGTEDAYFPFGLPDSHWLALFADGKLVSRKGELDTPERTAAQNPRL
jgi:hypothetical protein